MDILTATTEIPVILVILAVLLGVFAGVLMLAGAIYFLNQVSSSKEAAPHGSNGKVKGDASVVAAQIAKPVPPPRPLSRKEKMDLERLLKRQTDIRTAVSAPLPSTLSPRPMGPASSSQASQVAQSVAGVAELEGYHKPAPDGATCSLCDSVNVYEHAPVKRAKNSRILHFLTCLDCRKRSTMWTDNEA